MSRLLLGLALAVALLAPAPASADWLRPRRVVVVNNYYATPVPAAYYPSPILAAAPAPLVQSYYSATPAAVPVVGSYYYAAPVALTPAYYATPVRRSFYAVPSSTVIFYGR